MRRLLGRRSSILVISMEARKRTVFVWIDCVLWKQVLIGGILDVV